MRKGERGLVVCKGERMGQGPSKYAKLLGK
jgi:hypothetical protein